jgi:hypothetical protein
LLSLLLPPLPLPLLMLLFVAGVVRVDDPGS